MRTCPTCGGELGRECFDPRECAMHAADQQAQPPMTSTTTQGDVREALAQAKARASRRGVDVMDPDAVERYREMWRGKDGHDMAPINYNSLRRLIALIDTLAVVGGEELREQKPSDLRDIFERPFDGADDPRIRLAQALTRTEAEAVLEYRGDIVRALSSPPSSEGVREALQEAIAIFEGMNDDEINEEFLPRARALLSPPPSSADCGPGWRPTHRHVKRGTEYQVVDEADLQTEAPLTDYAVLTVYRGPDGRLWARPSTEFNDGRFEPLAAAPNTKGEAP